MNRLTLLALPVAIVLLTGCDPYVAPLTTAPPTAVAELDVWEDEARLSQGIALAVECTYQNTPCEAATASSDDPEVVRVFPGYVDLLAPADVYQRPPADKPRAIFILVGNKEGETTVRINTESGDGEAEIGVTVLPPP